MYQTPYAFNLCGSKFLFAIASSVALTTGSFIAVLFIRTLPSYIGVRSLFNMICNPVLYTLIIEHIGLRSAHL